MLVLSREAQLPDRLEQPVCLSLLTLSVAMQSLVKTSQQLTLLTSL
jgi:hypothetical protein